MINNVNLNIDFKSNNVPNSVGRVNSVCNIIIQNKSLSINSALAHSYGHRYTVSMQEKRSDRKKKKNKNEIKRRRK